ncbi:hypothetical protein ACTOV4_18930 [Brucella sp. C7-11G]
MGKIVDQRIFREPPRQILVDATQAEEVAGASVLHLGIKQCRRRKLERLGDRPQRGADDLVAAER